MPTILHRLVDWAQTAPQAPAQRFKSNGEWKTITAYEYRERVYHLALFLESRGMKPREVGAIFSFNSPEWTQTDLALLLMGARSAGLYPNSTPQELLYILEHSESKLLAVQNREYYTRITGAKGEFALPDRIETVLVFDGDTSICPKAIGFEEALALGRKLAADRRDATQLQKYLGAIDPKAGAILIYTSGTTSNPKGALLSHDNLAFTADIVCRYWKLPYAQGDLFSFLPLCHIAERLQSTAVGITQRYTVSFCTKFENVSTELVEVQPSLLLCVPRLWEKMMETVQNRVKRETPIKKRMIQWAFDAGARFSHVRMVDGKVSPIDMLSYKIADRWVLGAVRRAMGLGRAEVIASGAAALPAHVSRWFRCLGLEILEDYGQTESTGVISMTEIGVESAGTVGKPLPGTEFKIADDGEILTRGRHVFVSYLKDDAATAAALQEGWLHTGDLGKIDQNGRIRINGRKKEILKTSNGKMIAPLPIEEKLKESELINQVCMVGDGRKYLSALITLSNGCVKELEDRGVSFDEDEVTDPAIVSQIKAQVDVLNRSLAPHEQIKKFAILSREFSVMEGEMTPTLKMRRSVIESRFKAIIDHFYHEPTAGQLRSERSAEHG